MQPEHTVLAHVGVCLVDVLEGSTRASWICGVLCNLCVLCFVPCALWFVFLCFAVCSFCVRVVTHLIAVFVWSMRARATHPAIGEAAAKWWIQKRERLRTRVAAERGGSLNRARLMN